jgi:hypothetical protein
VHHFKPIYFPGPLHRQKRHDFIRNVVLADEREMGIQRDASTTIPTTTQNEEDE